MLPVSLRGPWLTRPGGPLGASTVVRWHTLGPAIGVAEAGPRGSPWPGYSLGTPRGPRAIAGSGARVAGGSAPSPGCTWIHRSRAWGSGSRGASVGPRVACWGPLTGMGASGRSRAGGCSGASRWFGSWGPPRAATVHGAGGRHAGAPAGPAGAPGVAMWVGYSLNRQGGRQGVLYGAGRGRGVGPQDHRVLRARALHVLGSHHHPGVLWKTPHGGPWVRGAGGGAIARGSVGALLVLLVGL